METATTEGIKISVATLYENEASKPRENLFVFSYLITIENISDQVTQLLSREWQIFDSIGIYHEVKGEGVIGKQPVLHPGETYTYESSCYLSSDMGKMSGHYGMQRRGEKNLLKVRIPEFQLLVPHKMN